MVKLRKETVKRRKNRNSRHSRTSFRRKVLGQYFLTSDEVRDRIISSLGSLEDKHVLEIGAGRGALTSELAERAGRLTALEIDSRLAEELEPVFEELPAVTILKEDALQFDYVRWADSCAPLKPLVVGNIPYGITNSLLYALIGSHARLETVVLMLQQEVARKLSTSAGHKPYGMLTVFVSYNAEVEYLFRVGRDNFSPRPKVDSAVLKLDFKNSCRRRADNEVLFETMVRSLFLNRRKQIQKILRSDRRFAVSAEKIARLEQYTGLKLSRRPEEMRVEQLVALADGLNYMKEKT